MQDQQTNTLDLFRLPNFDNTSVDDIYQLRKSVESQNDLYDDKDKNYIDKHPSLSSFIQSFRFHKDNLAK